MLPSTSEYAGTGQLGMWLATCYICIAAKWNVQNLICVNIKICAENLIPLEQVN